MISGQFSMFSFLCAGLMATEDICIRICMCFVYCVCVMTSWMFSCVWAWSDDNGGHRQQHGCAREGGDAEMCRHPLVRLQGVHIYHLSDYGVSTIYHFSMLKYPFQYNVKWPSSLVYFINIWLTQVACLKNCPQVAWVHIDRQMILTIGRHVITRIPR